MAQLKTEVKTTTFFLDTRFGYVKGVDAQQRTVLTTDEMDEAKAFATSRQARVFITNAEKRQLQLDKNQGYPIDGEIGIWKRTSFARRSK